MFVHEYRADSGSRGAGRLPAGGFGKAVWEDGPARSGELPAASHLQDRYSGSTSARGAVLRPGGGGDVEFF